MLDVGNGKFWMIERLLWVVDYCFAFFADYKEVICLLKTSITLTHTHTLHAAACIDDQTIKEIKLLLISI